MNNEAFAAHPNSIKPGAIRSGPSFLTGTVMVAGLVILSPADAESQSVRDSAGIRIVWATPEASNSTLRISAQPVLTIGQADGDDAYLLDGTTGAVRFVNGNIAIASQGSFNVRFYDDRGRHLSTFGRRGMGPREFEPVGGMMRCGETAIVRAPDKAVAYRLDRDGKYRGDVPLKTKGWMISSQRNACNPAGDLLAISWGSNSNPDPGPHRDRVRAAWLDPNSGGTAFLGTFDGEDRFRHANSDGPLDLGRVLVHALGPDRAIVGEGNIPELRFHDRQGRLRQIVRWSATPDAFTARDRAAYVEAQTNSLTGSRLARANQFYASFQFPAVLPPYAAVILDEQSRIWVQRYPRPSQNQTTFLVFSMTGILLRQVTLPRALTVYDVREGYLIGQDRDELGVERVHVFSVIPWL